MSARPLATVTISFGLVSIPVKLYTASQPQAQISFNLLHKKCGSRLKQQYVCSTEGTVVDRDDIIKGYEYAKGQYVTFTPEELERLEAVSTEAIEITEFVPAAKVDPVYFDKAYYLGPDRGGDKAYKLLAEAMKETGRSAVAKYQARGKQYLVLLRPIDGGIVMQQLRYADEVRPVSEVPLPADVEVKEAERKLAVQLIDQISSDAFRPEQYEDEVKKRIERLIAEKVGGKELAIAPPEPPRGQIVDLMEALKASLAAKAGPPAAAPAPAAAAGREGGEAAERKPPKRAESREEGKKAKPARKVS